MSINIECVISGAPRLGEGAVWDIQDQRLWWVDITGGLIHCYDPESGQNQTFDFGEPVGSLARRDKGGLVVSARSGFWLYDPETGQKTALSDPEAHLAENRFNDGTADPAGRFWAGTMMDEKPQRQQGCFYCLEADYGVRSLDWPVYTTNGLAFSPDGSVMYFADSHMDIRKVWKAQYEARSGTLSDIQPFFDTAGLAGRPDGATVDSDGGYWLAGVGGWQLYRITADGVLDRVIDVPVEKPTKPMFGGADMDILYLTSIGFGLTEGTEDRQAEAGGLFAITGLGVTGLPQPRFAG